MKLFGGDATGEDISLSLGVSSGKGVRRNLKVFGSDTNGEGEALSLNVFGSDANGEGDPLSLGVVSEEGAELGLVDGL